MCFGACATSIERQHFNAGNAALKAKDYYTAKQHFYRCAGARMYVCMNQMGVTNYQEGDREEAIKWFKLGARFGDKSSIDNLIRLGQVVPIADQVSGKQESSLNLGEALGAKVYIPVLAHIKERYRVNIMSKKKKGDCDGQ